MKTLVTMLILGASIASHAGIIKQTSNSECSARTGGGLTNIGNTNPAPQQQRLKLKQEKDTRDTANAPSNWSHR